MRKLILAIMFLQLCCTNTNAQTGVTTTRPGLVFGSGVKVEIFENDKMTPNKMLVDYSFSQEIDGSWSGWWQHIFIAPNEGAKDVILKIQRYSTDEGTIQNLQSFSDGCSFELLVSTDRKYQLVIKGKGSSLEVKGRALWYSEMLKEEVRIKWESTNKLYFELPYKKVF